MDLMYSLPGTETVTLTGQTINKLIHAGDGDAALLYLYILNTSGKNSSSEAANALGKSIGEIANLMAVLSRLGLVEINRETEKQNRDISDVNAGGSTDAYDAAQRNRELEEEKRSRTLDEVKQELESGSVFSALVEETQKSLGKILSPDELLRLFGIYDSLKMEPEVILHLVTHCISESRARSNGRMPSIRYIEKAAYTWEREGILTLDCAEDYIKRLEARRSIRGEIKDSLMIKNRELSETESRYVDNWIAQGFRAEAAAIAYDRTVFKTGKLAWNYMDKIMSSWHNKGLYTAEEIMKKDKGPERLVNRNQTSAQKFGAADQSEVERMQRILNKIKED